MGQYQEAVSRSQGLRGGAKAPANAKQAGGFRWESRPKYSPLTADYNGYSSDASADAGRPSIQLGVVFYKIIAIHYQFPRFPLRRLCSKIEPRAPTPLHLGTDVHKRTTHTHTHT